VLHRGVAFARHLHFILPSENVCLSLCHDRMCFAPGARPLLPNRGGDDMPAVGAYPIVISNVPPAMGDARFFVRSVMVMDWHAITPFEPPNCRLYIIHIFICREYYHNNFCLSRVGYINITLDILVIPHYYSSQGESHEK